MNPCRLVLSLVLFIPALAAQGQELVTNGTFTGTLAPWVMGGAYSVNPGLETGWDTTGFGPSDSFGVNAGGQVTPAPYPPNWIEQQILVVQGLTYEFRCDASGARPGAPTVNNADTGTIWVEVDNVEVARHAFGSYSAGQVKRAQVCGRFVTTTTGLVTLRINTARTFLANASTPRVNIDNVSVRDVTGPTFWIRGNRQLGGNVSYAVRGTPGAPFATFVALAESPAPVQIPGVQNDFWLDIVTTATVQFGLLDANGESNTGWTVPTNPLFLQVGLYYQGGMIDVLPMFGLHFGVLASQ